MKRMWIGVGLLAVMLTAGLLMSGTMEKRISPNAEKLLQAAAAAMDENWQEAAALTDAVRADWDRVSRLAELLSTHEDLEQIETAFTQLSSYQGIDGPAYSALCTALARQMEALAKTHGCSWENLL